MASQEIERFALDFFAAASTYVDQDSHTFYSSLGESSVKVTVNRNNNVSALIEGALLTSPKEAPNFSLEIWRTDSSSHLPNLDWARSYLAHDNLVPFSLTSPYRVAFDKSQGFIYLYDTSKKRAAIWVADDSQISLNSFVTPFRIIFSWMAESFGGEIVHASAISQGGKGLIINGPSGSGKSTLALLCALNGFEMIADDVVLAHDGSISAVYRYAKVEPHTSPLDLSHLTTFQMASTPDAKNILDLNQFGSRFVTRSTASAIVLPIFAHVNQHAIVSPAIAIKLLAPNSLRELMGGTPVNFKNLVSLTKNLPNYRIALSTDNQKNIDSIKEIFAELP